MLRKKRYLLQFILIGLLLFCINAFAQNNYKAIPLPIQLRGINLEFSGMAQLGSRVYVLPQYGNHYETRLNGEFDLYSFNADSISRVIEGLDTALTAYRALKVKGLEVLPANLKKTYQGFETLTFVGKYAYMAIETVDTAANCYLLRGVIDTIANEVVMDAQNYLTLPRPFFISNAGFESITWLPKVKKLIAFYEFNARAGSNFAYLIDTSLTLPPKAVSTPFLYFRNTDAVTAPDGSIYAINYYWDGDYDKYLNNNFISRPEHSIKRPIPSLKDSLALNPTYLKQKTFARIIRIKKYKRKKWKEVAVFNGFKNNWEGITLFKKGALVISDANRSTKQITQMVYVEF